MHSKLLQSMSAKKTQKACFFKYFMQGSHDRAEIVQDICLIQKTQIVQSGYIIDYIQFI